MGLPEFHYRTRPVFFLVLPGQRRPSTNQTRTNSTPLARRGMNAHYGDILRKRRLLCPRAELLILSQCSTRITGDRAHDTPPVSGSCGAGSDRTSGEEVMTIPMNEVVTFVNDHELLWSWSL